MSAMSKKTRHDGTDPRDDSRESDADAASSGLGQRAGASGSMDELPEHGSEDARDPEIEQLRRENEEHLQNWKRATADYQNLRRRLQADIDAASQRSKQPLILDLLLVLDYLEMALKTPCTTAEGKNLSAGVELTRSVLLRALERESVRAVPEKGKFDPAVHQAVERVETDEHEAGTILGTLRRGYASGDQVIRPAQVKVAVEIPSRSGLARNAGDSGASASEAQS
jgi:molecular chaperone GrpE